VHLVGHDWGAVVAWAYAGAHPETLASLTALSVPHPRAYMRALPRSSQLLKSYYIGLFQIPGVERAVSRGPGTRKLKSSGMTREMIDDFRTGIVDYGALRGGLSWYRSMPAMRPNVMPGRITVPTTFIWSEGDVFINRTAAEGCGRYVDADFAFEELPDANHWLPGLRPTEVAEFVARRAGLP
jgi:pimeloyl-ACP methyl ester carboxylesterase